MIKIFSAKFLNSSSESFLLLVPLTLSASTIAHLGSSSLANITKAIHFANMTINSSSLVWVFRIFILHI
jgi:hypothetical protein